MNSTAESVNFEDEYVFDNSKMNRMKVLSKEKYAQDLLAYYEKSFINQKFDYQQGEVIEGTIVKVVNGHFALDFGAKDFAYMPIEETSFAIGDTIKAVLTEVNIDNKLVRGFSYKCSHNEYVKGEYKNSMVDAIGTSKVFDGKLLEIVNNSGFIVNVNGVNCFMPGSLAGINKISNFDELIGTSLKVMAVSMSDDKSVVIVSHKAFLESNIPHELSKLDMISKIQGKVTGTTKYAIFAEFNGCLTGMIHKSSMDAETSKRFDGGLIKPNEEISFYVKEVVNNKKIILSQIKDEFWDNIDSYISNKTTFEGKVISVTEGKGYLIEIENGTVKGILSSKNTNRYQINSVVSVKVKEYKNRKIFFES